MKTINCIDCEVIKDLLPSYADKISSESSNKLVEEHLKKCKNCTNVLKNMNKEVDNEIIENQDEQIDYLKKYRMKKIKSNLIEVILLIIIFIEIVLIISCLPDLEFSVNINEFSVNYHPENRSFDRRMLTISLGEEPFDIECHKREVEDNGNGKILYIRPMKKICLVEDNFAMDSIEIYEHTTKIYLEDKKGNVREIWNKDMMFQEYRLNVNEEL